MTAARSRKLFIAALLVSLLIHFLLAGYIRWPAFLQPHEEQIAKVRVMRVERRVPPTPPPTPVPTPAATPQVHASIAPPTITHHTEKGPAPITKTQPVTPKSTPQPPATPLPTPVAEITPAGPCGGHANTNASVIATPAPIDLPPEARASRVSGTTAVRVTLDAQAHITDATIAQSSGSTALDSVAIQIARNATYAPKYVSCKPVASDYTYTVKFVSW